MKAAVQVLTGDVLQKFADEVGRSRERLERLTLVSPWVTLSGGESVLDMLLQRCARDRTRVLLVTRPGTGPCHAAAISAVDSMPRGRVLLNRRLHAKLYICEFERGREFAVISSANMTAASGGLDEIGLLIRPLGGSRMISRLAPAATRLAGRRSARRRLTGHQLRRPS